MLMTLPLYLRRPYELEAPSFNQESLLLLLYILSLSTNSELNTSLSEHYRQYLTERFLLSLHFTENSCCKGES
jgi:hypothetical protein